MKSACTLWSIFAVAQCGTRIFLGNLPGEDQGEISKTAHWIFRDEIYANEAHLEISPA